MPEPKGEEAGTYATRQLQAAAPAPAAKKRKAIE
jgi:hypothetical protein